jgi:hypothetical protein
MLLDRPDRHLHSTSRCTYIHPRSNNNFQLMPKSLCMERNLVLSSHPSTRKFGLHRRRDRSAGTVSRGTFESFYMSLEPNVRKTASSAESWDENTRSNRGKLQKERSAATVWFCFGEPTKEDPSAFQTCLIQLCMKEDALAEYCLGRCLIG